MTDIEDAEKRGEIAGRLSAMENRLDRYEAFVGEQLRSINSGMSNLDKTMNQMLGGNKMFSMFLTVAAALGSGLFVKYLH